METEEDVLADLLLDTDADAEDDDAAESPPVDGSTDADPDPFLDEDDGEEDEGDDDDDSGDGDGAGAAAGAAFPAAVPAWPAKQAQPATPTRCVLCELGMLAADDTMRKNITALFDFHKMHEGSKSRDLLYRIEREYFNRVFISDPLANGVRRDTLPRRLTDDDLRQHFEKCAPSDVFRMCRNIELVEKEIRALDREENARYIDELVKLSNLLGQQLGRKRDMHHRDVLTRAKVNKRANVLTDTMLRTAQRTLDGARRLAPGQMNTGKPV